MAEYLILIYGDEAHFTDMDQQQLDKLLQEHGDFQARNGAAIKGRNALQPTDTATAIRSDDSGRYDVTDGPFAETKEALGGYYLVEAADLDEAIAIAKQIPAPHGGVEVRPVQVFS
jgi:hypothetical protein